MDTSELLIENNLKDHDSVIFLDVRNKNSHRCLFPSGRSQLTAAN